MVSSSGSESTCKLCLSGSDVGKTSFYHTSEAAGTSKNKEGMRESEGHVHQAIL